MTNLHIPLGAMTHLNLNLNLHMSGLSPPGQAKCGCWARTRPRASQCLCGRGCMGRTCSAAWRASRTSAGSRCRGWVRAAQCCRLLQGAPLMPPVRPGHAGLALCSCCSGPACTAAPWAPCQPAQACQGLHAPRCPRAPPSLPAAAADCGHQERDPGGCAGHAGLPKSAGPKPGDRLEAHGMCRCARRQRRGAAGPVL